MGINPLDNQGSKRIYHTCKADTVLSEHITALSGKQVFFQTFTPITANISFYYCKYFFLCSLFYFI